MGFWKGLACVAGGIGAIIAAPIVLPVAAAAAAAAGTAVASSAVGAAVVGAAGTAGTAIASSAAGAAVVGASSAVTGAVAAVGTAAASTAVGGVVTGVASSVASGVAAGAATVGVTAGGAAAATVGGGMTYSAITTKEAFDNFDSAKRVIADSRNRYENKQIEIDEVIVSTSKRMGSLNEYKVDTYRNEVKQSLELIKKITKAKETSTDFFDADSVRSLFEPGDIKRMEAGVTIADGVSHKLLEGSSLMQATAGFASQMVGQFGFSTTGTAISSLSGAAAQRATLAAFGGGSLASGGAGMVGGQIMLGGLTLVPTAVMMSWKMAANSEHALTEALKYHSTVAKATEDMGKQQDILENAVVPRIDELEACLVKMRTGYRTRLLPSFQESIARNESADGKVDFSLCSDADRNRINLSIYYLKKMVEVMRVKVLDSTGRPDRYAKTVLNEIEKDSKILGVT